MSLRPMLVAAAAACLFHHPADAVVLRFTNPYGEMVDRGDVSAHLWDSNGAELECPTSVSYAQTGNKITLTTRKAPPGQTDMGTCRHTSSVVLGPYAAGTYEVTGRIRSVDGLTYDTVTENLAVLPIDGRCNPEPALSPSIVGTPAGMTATQFVARANSDPTFAVALGNPALRVAPYNNEVYFDYPPLEDIPPAMARLDALGVLTSQWRNSYACFATSPPDQTARFIEFHHAGLDHYFYSGDAGEIAAIDAGQVGPGWSRTGKFFHATTVPGCPFSASGQSVVYRFFGIPGVGPNSHFFTRDRAECKIVDRSAKWSFEGLPFWSSKPATDGSCPTGFTALYRAWRPIGDSNHRYTTERKVIGDMVAKGWIDEGPAMCVLDPD